MGSQIMTSKTAGSESPQVWRLASGWIRWKGFAEEPFFPSSQGLEKGVVNDDRLLGST